MTSSDQDMIIRAYTWAHLARMGIWIFLGNCALCIFSCGFLDVLRKDESYTYLYIVLISSIAAAGCGILTAWCNRKIREIRAIDGERIGAAVPFSDPGSVEPGRRCQYYKTLEENIVRLAEREGIPLPCFGKRILAVLAVPCLLVLGITAVTAHYAPYVRGAHKEAVSKVLFEMIDVYNSNLLEASTDPIEKDPPYRAIGYLTEDHKSYICANINWVGETYSLVYRTSVLCADDKADTLEQCESMIREMYEAIQDLTCVDPGFQAVYPVDEAFRELFLSDERYFDTHGGFVTDGENRISCDIDFTYYGKSEDGSNNATLICTVKSLNS